MGDALKAAIAPRLPYPRVKGSQAVREAIAAYMQRRFGVSLNPDTQIVPTSGSKEAVFHMPLLVIDRDADDRGVIFPDPATPHTSVGRSSPAARPLPFTSRETTFSDRGRCPRT